MTDGLAMLDSFAAYLRRQLGSAGGEVVQLGMGQSIRKGPRDGAIAVVAGARSAVGEQAFRLRSGMAPQWRGIARPAPGAPGVPFSVWDRWPVRKVPPAPAGFDVLAIVTTYNEESIVDQTLSRLTRGGVRVHVIDNWSTDRTVSVVERHLGAGAVTMERFPAGGPEPYFALEPLLRRVSEVAHASGADWVVHHDCDEIHESAWPGISLRQGLYALDRWGFNCVDHTVAEFRPVAESWRPGDDLASGFTWFEFGPAPAHFTLLRAWKPQPDPVSNAESGGHSVEFPGRRVFPYKFVLRHYPLRSTAHARKKLFEERRPRWKPEERAMGWHAHYDGYDEASSFLWDPSSLVRWADVDRDFLLQRLSGVWLPNNPFLEEAAAPPR